MMKRIISAILAIAICGTAVAQSPLTTKPSLRFMGRLTCSDNALVVAATGLPACSGVTITGSGAVAFGSGGTVVYAGGSLTPADQCLKVDGSGRVVVAGATCGANSNTPHVQDFLTGTDFTPGVTTSLTLSSSPSDPALLSLTFDGVVQSHNTWSLAAAVVTFSAAIPANTQVVEAHWYSPSTTAGVGNLNGLTGAVNLLAGTGIILNTSAPNIIVSADPAFQTPLVQSMTALRALAPAAYSSVYLGGYYGPGTAGSGYFFWDGTSSAADNAGSIIIPNAGGTGRWKRINLLGAIYSPDDFGARATGTTTAGFDDAVPIRAAMAALNALGGGTLAPSCNSQYNLASVGANGAAINNYPRVNIIGCGRSSSFRLANGMNSLSTFVFGIWPSAPTTLISDAVYRDFTVDMNGQNNSCSGACWAYSVALGAGYAQTVYTQRVWVLNNAGSQGIAYGTNSATPTASDLFINDNYLSAACDYINAACLDHSAIWIRATSGSVTGNIVENAGQVYGTGIEVHGVGIVASGNSVSGTLKGIIVAADTFSATPLDSNTIVASGNVFTSVGVGVDVWALATTTVRRIIVTDNAVSLTFGSLIGGVDAYTHVGSTQTFGLVVTGNTISNEFGGTSESLNYGILVGYWQSAQVSSNTLYGMSGAGIIFPSPTVGGVSVYNVNNNIIRDVGRNVGTPAVKAGILFGGTATAGIINIQANSIKNSSTAYITTAISGTMNSDGGLIGGNVTSEIATPINWTGLGIIIGQTCSGTPTSSFGTLNGVVGRC